MPLLPPLPPFPPPPLPPSFLISLTTNAKLACPRTAASSTPSGCPSTSSAGVTTSSLRRCTTHDSAGATARGCSTTATIPPTTPSSRRSSTTWASGTSPLHHAYLTSTCPWACWSYTRRRWSTGSCRTWWPSHARVAKADLNDSNMLPDKKGSRFNWVIRVTTKIFRSLLKHFKRQLLTREELWDDRWANVLCQFTVCCFSCE